MKRRCAQVLITAPAMTYRYSSSTGVSGDTTADAKRQLRGIDAVLRDAACTQALLQVLAYLASSTYTYCNHFGSANDSIRACASALTILSHRRCDTAGTLQQRR
jgi:predicted ATP-grasp superfamily ATP-dependent carboligase